MRITSRLAVLATVVTTGLGLAAVPAAASAVPHATFTRSWHLQSPPNPSGSIVSELTGVSCSALSACLAVGSEETATSLNMAFAESWDGSSWTLLNVPNAPKTSLNAVDCLSATNCVVVGDAVPSNQNDTVTLAEVWNGSTWTTQSTLTPARAARASLTGVACRSATQCMAVGWFSRSQPGNRLLLAEHWTGQHWRIRATPGPSGAASSQFNGVSCASGLACIAVGKVLAPAGAMLAESWNGTRWVLLSTPDPAGGSQSNLQGVSCTADTACTATGDYFNGSAVLSLAEVWNGASWAQQSTPNPAGAVSTGLGAVSCPTARQCTAVGGATGQTRTRPVAEQWNGSAWRLQYPGQPSGDTESNLMGVSCPGHADCTAVGGSGGRQGNLVPLAAQYF